MHLYRKIIPKIARDIVRTLTTNKTIEVEDGKLEEAELDLAAVMVEYLNSEDRVIKEAKEVLQRRGLGPDRFNQVKKSVAEARGVKIGEDATDYILQQLVEALFASRNVAEIFGEDNELRKTIKELMGKHLSVTEDIDREARARLKNVREGTAEWEIEYPRMVSQLRRQKGLS